MKELFNKYIRHREQLQQIKNTRLTLELQHAIEVAKIANSPCPGEVPEHHYVDSFALNKYDSGSNGRTFLYCTKCGRCKSVK